MSVSQNINKKIKKSRGKKKKKKREEVVAYLDKNSQSQEQASCARR
jgi:hypothetical protein